MPSIMSSFSSLAPLWALIFAGGVLSRGAFSLRMDNGPPSSDGPSEEGWQEKRNARFSEKVVSNPTGSRLSVTHEGTDDELLEEGEMPPQKGEEEILMGELALPKKKTLFPLKQKQELLQPKTKTEVITKTTTQDRPPSDCVICLQPLRPKPKVPKLKKKPRGSREKKCVKVLTQEPEGETVPTQEPLIIKLIPDPKSVSIKDEGKNLCGHEFHQECFEKYVNSFNPRKDTCPVCRTKFSEEQMPPREQIPGMNSAPRISNHLEIEPRSRFELEGRQCSTDIENALRLLRDGSGPEDADALRASIDNLVALVGSFRDNHESVHDVADWWRGRRLERRRLERHSDVFENQNLRLLLRMQLAARFGGEIHIPWVAARPRRRDNRNGNRQRRPAGQRPARGNRNRQNRDLARRLRASPPLICFLVLFLMFLLVGVSSGLSPSSPADGIGRLLGFVICTCLISYRANQ